MDGRIARIARYGLSILVTVVIGGVGLGHTPSRSAQLPLPIPVGGNAQDAAVRAALSEFGKAVGVQLPIVVSPSDALPTSDLPGAPFAPGQTPNIVGALRNASDGTVELQPGDYQFVVDVFCMKASAHSPSGHRYLVAPLHGAYADIFSALNTRAPSYALNHMALQILSWQLQAGLPYAQMGASQRAIVDKVIPDFKPRLKTDILTQIHADYDRTVARVPGMPSFDDALSRIGPVGQDVIGMEQLRQQMAQPPPTVQQLIDELVPIGPLEPGGAGPTPWSRYSDRVYVRFVTSGNFATPGQYQVRVLAPQKVSMAEGVSLGPPDLGAPVPFGNIVNNPGTPSVQPLTQSPQGGQPQPTPKPSPSPSAHITSQTVATEPGDRTRLTIGVDEQVRLTFSGGNADWSISGAGGTVSSPGKTSLYTASDVPASETITAVDQKTHATATITFDVIAPSGLLFEVSTPGTQVHHHQGWPDIGFSAHVYVQPETVSFQYIAVREDDATFVATGYYSFDNGESHHPNTGYEIAAKFVAGKGWELPDLDDVWSGRQPAPKPFKPGYASLFIPVEYTDAGETPGNNHIFTHVSQTCELKKDGSTIEATKGNAKVTLTIASPDYR